MKIAIKSCHPLDFKDGLNDKGFTFDNPNVNISFGFGESFSI
jgi:Fe-S cluster assembly iron-binding protein IscA